MLQEPQNEPFVSIHFMDHSGIVHARPLPNIATTPVVKAAFLFGNDPLPVGHPINYTQIWAMVDTGADYTYLDPSTIALSGLTKLRDTKVSSATNTEASAQYRGNLFFPETGASNFTEIISAPLKQQRPNIGMIIGMFTLSKYVLVMDPKNHKYRLYTS